MWMILSSQVFLSLQSYQQLHHHFYLVQFISLIPIRHIATMPESDSDEFNDDVASLTSLVL